MADKKKRRKKTRSPERMMSFSWGGTTEQWEEEADQVMHILENELDNQVTDRDLENRINNVRRLHYRDD